MVCCSFVVRESIHLNAGHFVYALDDPYIEMALAKNVVRHGVYGVTQYAATAASSSIVWPWVLAACYAVVGVNIWTPYVLNIVCCLALLYLGGRIMVDASGGRLLRALQTASLIVLVVAAPMPTLCQIGMEHSAQCLAMAALLYSGAKCLNKPSDRRLQVQTAILAAAATSIRYEGAFAVLAICAGLLLARRFKAAAVTALGGLLPILLYGFTALAHGQYFFPNSVLVKTFGKTSQPLASHISVAFELDPLLLAVGFAVIVTTAFTLGRREIFGWVWTFGALYAFIFALHVASIGVYVFYRYQAYLVVVGIVALFAFACRWYSDESRATIGGKCVTVVTLAVLAAIDPLGQLNLTAEASHDIYRQQYLDAMFIRTYYNHGTALLNDIGAAAYYTDAHIVDYVGLASKAFARLSIQHRDKTRAFIAAVDSTKPDIGIVYLTWLPQIDSHWIIAANRTVTPSIVCADPKLTYIAFTPSGAAKLKPHVKLFFQLDDTH